MARLVGLFPKAVALRLFGAESLTRSAGLLLHRAGLSPCRAGLRSRAAPLLSSVAAHLPTAAGLLPRLAGWSGGVGKLSGLARHPQGELRKQKEERQPGGRIKAEVELVALRRVAPRRAAQRRVGSVGSVRSARTGLSQRDSRHLRLMAFPYDKRWLRR